MPRRTRITSRKRSVIPALPSKSHDELISETYERLGVAPSAISDLPIISHILKSIPGGQDKAVEYLRGSAEPDARKWLAVYDQIPISYRHLIPIEAYCLASGLTTKRVLELITGACFEQSDSAANLIAKASKPKIIEATVESAMMLGHEGAQDRKMMHLHEGFVPVPKTSVVNVQGNVIQDNRLQSISIGELGRLDNDMSRLEDKFNQRFGLGDGTIIDAEAEDVPVGSSEGGDVDELRARNIVPDGMPVVRTQDVVAGGSPSPPEDQTSDSEWEL